MALVMMLAWASSACSTHYAPRPGPRISVVMEGGQLAYVRDGRSFEHGFAGSGLVEATEGDPEAQEAAETYHSRTLTGFWLSMVGVACLVGGLVLLASTDNYETTNTALLTGSLACGIGAPIAGSFVAVSGVPYHWDAINRYNDNAETRRWQPAPGYPPTLPAGPAPPSAPPEPPAAAPAPSAPAADQAGPAPEPPPGAAPSQAAPGPP